MNRHDHPILIPDQPHELGRTLTAVTVLSDPETDRLRMYYLAFNRDNPLDNALCIAFSSDGTTWEKPDLGEGHNIVMRGAGYKTGWGQFMSKRILFDPHDDNPAHRWKMIYWDRPSEHVPPGICLAVSPDGCDWSPLPNGPVIRNANDAASLINGPTANPIRNGNYLIYQQTWKYNPNLPIDRDNLKGMHRRISIWYSPTFASHVFDGGWTGPITILEPDADDPPDVQFYWLTPYHTPTGFGGLLLCHHTTDQTMDVQLVTGTDGWTWNRANNRQPILPLGAPGRFDCGLITTLSPPVLWQNKALIYYNGRATVHDGQLRYPDQPSPEPLTGIGLAEYVPKELFI